MKNISEIQKAVNRAGSILIVFNNTFSRENLCAALGYYNYLKNIGKDVEIIATYYIDKSENNLLFLQGFERINVRTNDGDFVVKIDVKKDKLNKIRYNVSENDLKLIISNNDEKLGCANVSSYREIKYDTIVCIGINDLNEIGELYKQNVGQFDECTIINISCDDLNGSYGDLNYVRNDRTVMAQLIVGLVGYELVDSAIATCLFTSILARTNYFKNEYVSGGVLQMSSRLIELGADKDVILKKMHNSRGISEIKSWGKTLMNIESEHNERLSWFLFDSFDVDSKREYIEANIIDLINEMVITIRGIEVVIAFYELQIEGEVSVSALVVSDKGFVMSELTGKFACVGSSRIVRLTDRLPLGEFREKVLAYFRGRLG